jgi:hypothetical protein
LAEAQARWLFFRYAGGNGVALSYVSNSIESDEPIAVARIE